MKSVVPVFAFALVTTSGCIAVGAKVHTGVVRDDAGAGVQVGASAMFGYAGKRSAALGQLGIAGGSAPTVGLDGGFQYVHFPKDEGRIGIRAGLGGVTLGEGEPRPYGARIATLFVLRERSSYDPGHEKIGFGGTTNSVLAAGLEGMIGFTSRDGAEGEADRLSLAGGAAVSLEWYWLSRMKL